MATTKAPTPKKRKQETEGGEEGGSEEESERKGLASRPNLTAKLGQ